MNLFKCFKKYLCFVLDFVSLILLQIVHYKRIENNPRNLHNTLIPKENFKILLQRKGLLTKDLFKIFS